MWFSKRELVVGTIGVGLCCCMHITFVPRHHVHDITSNPHHHKFTAKHDVAFIRSQEDLEGFDLVDLDLLGG